MFESSRLGSSTSELLMMIEEMAAHCIEVHLRIATIILIVMRSAFLLLHA
jgi:hypothetical protein